MHPASIAAAVWTYGTRTLTTGTPAAPTNRQERIAIAVWQYAVRTLGGAPAAPGVHRIRVTGRTGYHRVTGRGSNQIRVTGRG